MGLLLVDAVNNRMQKLMVSAGYGPRAAGQLLMINVGAIGGLLVAGRLGDRMRLKPAAVHWITVGGLHLAVLSVKMAPGLMLRRSS